MWLSIVVCGEKTLQKLRAITIFDQLKLLAMLYESNTRWRTQGYPEAFQTAEKIFASYSCNDLHLYGKKQPLIIGQ